MNRLNAYCLRGFSAIDLLIVFSITCICVVAGTPFLSNYAVRSRLTEAIVVADGAKTAITLACMEEPNLGALDYRSTGYTFDGARYVSDVEVEGSCAKATIRLLTIGTGAQPDPIVTFNGVTGASDKNMHWTCSGTGSELHLPRECRH